MRILKEKITIDELKNLSQNSFMSLVKAVVDVKKEIIAIDAELHSDLEELLLKNGSDQYDLWGINLYPEFQGEEFIEFDSMINLRPAQNNMTRGVESEETQEKIKEIVYQWIKD